MASFAKNSILKLSIWAGVLTACNRPQPAPPMDTPPASTVSIAAVDAASVQDTSKINSLESALNQHIALLGTLKRDESFQEQSEQLFKYLEDYKSTFFTLSENVIKKADIIMSPDKKLGFISWYWREGTEYNTRCVGIFKTNSGETKVVWLTNDDNNMGTFSKVWSVSTQNTPIYIAQANFSGPNRNAASLGVKLFQIEGAELKTPNLFPNNASAVSVEFDVRNVDFDKLAPIIEQTGQMIKIPIVEEDSKQEVFKGAYKIYRFDGTRFQLE
jgi:hypothetical protein